MSSLSNYILLFYFYKEKKSNNLSKSKLLQIRVFLITSWPRFTIFIEKLTCLTLWTQVPCSLGVMRLMTYQNGPPKIKLWKGDLWLKRKSLRLHTVTCLIYFIDLFLNSVTYFRKSWLCLFIRRMHRKEKKKEEREWNRQNGPWNY